MPVGEPQPVLIPFPLKGVHRGEPTSVQPELTTFDLRNVRALHLGDRRGGGRRSGTSKVFTTQAGASGSRRVNTLHAFSNQRQAGFGDTGEVSEDEVDFDPQAASSEIGAGWAYYNDVGNSGGATSHPEFQAALADILTSGLIDYQHIENGGIDAIVSTFKTNNKVTATWSANSDLDGAGFGQDGPDDSIATCGVFIRGDEDLTECLFLHAAFVSTSGGAGGGPEIRLTLSTSIDGTTATIWENPSGDIELNNDAGTETDAVFTLEELSSSQVRVTFSWPGAGAGGADISITADVNTSQINDSNNNRSGVGTFGGTSGRLHTLSSFAVFNLGVETSAVVAQVSGDDENTVGTDRYFIPDGFTAVHVDATTGTVTSEDGPAEQSSTQDYPQVDTSNATIHEGTGTLDARFFTTTDDPEDRLSPSLLIGENYTSGVASFCTRVADDFDSMIETRLTFARESTTNQVRINDVTIKKWIDGTDTQLYTTSSAFPEIVFHSSEAITVIDDGLDPDSETSTIQIVLNNIVVYEQELSAADAGSTANPELYDTGGDSFLRIGCGPGDEAERIRFINVGLEAEGGFADDDEQFGEATSYITVFTDSKIQAGRLDVGTLADVSGPIFPASRVSAANLGRKVYATNKNKSLIIDPITLTSEDWSAAVTAGSLPIGCELVAAFRGSIYLARQASNESIWYKSRTLNPLDYDFNAEPLATAAYAGSNAAIGQPGDSIIALAPYLDDFLLFLCAASIWAMEGDPGLGGRVINLSRGVGCLGPRAWAFDEYGRLYFLGSGGLYLLEGPGSLPRLISGTRLIGLLDRLNTDNTFIHLVYDAFRHCLHIFLTTEAGSDVHVVKDVRQGPDDGWFLDAFPDDHGPWSAAEIRGFKDIDRGVIIGGNDGYVRRFDDDANSDDGTAIEAYWDSAPMQPFGNRLESRVVEVNAELFEGSGSCTWEWYTADSADEVRQLSSSPEETGTWGASGAGFQEPVGVSARGGAHKLRVKKTSATSGFQMDHASALIEPSSRRR